MSTRQAICVKCRGEFDIDPGAPAICPFCGAEQTPGQHPLPVQAYPTLPTPREKEAYPEWPGTALQTVGSLLIFIGLVATAMAGSILTEIFGALHYCGGLLLVGVGCLIKLLATINRNL